jgi:hypothetical protein
MNLGWGSGAQYAWLRGIVAYLLAELDHCTGGGHFESIDCPLKLEAAPKLTKLPHTFPEFNSVARAWLVVALKYGRLARGGFTSVSCEQRVEYKYF